MVRNRPEKIRLDRLLVDRGLAESREKAQGLILAGQVLADNQKEEKCGASSIPKYPCACSAGLKYVAAAA